MGRGDFTSPSRRVELNRRDLRRRKIVAALAMRNRRYFTERCLP